MSIMAFASAAGAADEPWQLTLRSQRETSPGSGRFDIVIETEAWQPGETAIIVCDVWDYHHSVNANRRLAEFAPRLDELLKKGREAGVTIIHSPSDCMPAYEGHPARKRAQAAPLATTVPYDIASWCSKILSEERAVYPIDQSDGGVDDDPVEHADWAKKLADLGRNPNLPWQSQSSLITIDSERDYISDQGDEVWNVLESRNIKNVILTGVHVNMCVLGRPFGLRQMARNGKRVVLMRDLTDSMYNPERWPYISHFEGNDRVITHIERWICPSITSDQLLGGSSFRFSQDTRPASAAVADSGASSVAGGDFRRHWRNVTVPSVQQVDDTKEHQGVAWYRCVVFVPEVAPAAENHSYSLALGKSQGQGVSVWFNGQSLQVGQGAVSIPASAIIPGDHNLLVLRMPNARSQLTQVPLIQFPMEELSLTGRWQFRIGPADAGWENMPLPAKFGGAPDIVHAPPVPLWVARPLTRTGEFTPGIEGPCCDRAGNIFAVNFAKQGTIGRVTPQGAGEIFVELADGSIGNGICFDEHGDFYVADYANHNVLRVDPRSREVRPFAHNPAMNQPNDLAIADDGTLYASDPDWANSTGQLWRIDPDGTTTLLAGDLGTTNGLDVSPDGKTLYVNESNQRNVWAFSITKERTLSDKRLIRRFDDFGFDGMRVDVDGNLYITRYGKGTVIKMTPEGEILKEIDVLGSRPSNLCFGGPDGCTVYVTEVEYTRLVTFRADRPGRAWKP